jgi:hypothetical protein
MTTVSQTPATETTNTAAVATTTAAAPAAPKALSKKSLALAIFAGALVKRAAGEYADNKTFRQAVLRQIESDLGVSTASAATMYNAAKKEAETAGTLTAALGRDPKKEKPVSTGKRGRPVGSKNKAKDEAAAPALDTSAVEGAPASTEVAPVETTPAAAEAQA